MKKALLCSAFLLILSSCSDDGGGTVTPLDDKFSSIQVQTFDRTCNSSSCHGGSFPKALLDLTTGKSYNQLLGNPIQNTAAKSRYKALVVPGKPDSSFLYIKLKGPRSDEGVQMPERLPAISAPELEAIRIWIERGAPND